MLQSGVYDKDYNLIYTWSEANDVYGFVPSYADSSMQTTIKGGSSSSARRYSKYFYKSDTDTNDKVLVIDSSITAIDSYAFKSCWFKELIIPDSVVSFGEGWMQYGGAEKIITIPSTVESWGSYSFQYGTGSVDLSNTTLTAIGYRTFQEFSGTVILPSTIAALGTDTFKDCTSDTLTIKYMGTASQWKNVTNYSTVPTTEIYVASATSYYMTSKNLPLKVDRAICDADGNDIQSTYATKQDIEDLVNSASGGDTATIDGVTVVTQQGLNTAVTESTSLSSSDWADIANFLSEE